MDDIYNGNLRDKFDKQSDELIFINSCGIHKNRKLVVMREKGRVDYHLVYVKQGVLQVNVNGKDHTLEEGDFVIYHPGFRQLYRSEENNERLWIHYSGTYVAELMSFYGFENGVYRGRASSEIYELFNDIIYESLLPSKVALQKNSAMLQMLFVKLYESIGNDSYINPAVEMLVKKINTEPGTKIDVDEYVKMSGMGKERFMHIFKESIGKPLQKYITGVKMKEAQKLLKYSSYSVSQIAFSLGYEDALYFSRIFKKYMGVSPKMFRKK